MSLNDLSDFINDDKKEDVDLIRVEEYEDISVESFMDIISLFR